MKGLPKWPCLLVPLFGLTAMTVSTPASAGVWKGIVSHQGSPAAGATVTICNQSATTNNSGRFRIDVPDNTNRCPLRVSYQGRNSSNVDARLSPYLTLSLRSGPSGWVVEIK